MTTATTYVDRANLCMDGRIGWETGFLKYQDIQNKNLSSHDCLIEYRKVLVEKLLLRDARQFNISTAARVKDAREGGRMRSGNRFYQLLSPTS